MMMTMTIHHRTIIATIALYFGNLWYAVTKKSLSSSLPVMKKVFSLSPADIGRFSATFSIGYGLFKLVGGILTDYVPATTVFSLGLLFGSVINLTIPALPSRLDLIQACWAMNGAVQGGGGPALSKVVIEEFPSEQRASTWSSLLTVSYTSSSSSSSSSHTVINMMSTASSSIIWGPFWTAGAIGLVSSLAMLAYPVSRTQHTTSSSSTSSTTSDNNKVTPTHSSVAAVTLLEASLHTCLAAILIFSDMLTYFVIKGISDWLVQCLMHSSLEMDYTTAIAIAFWCEIGAILGSCVAGLLADGSSSSTTRLGEVRVSLFFTLATVFCFLLIASFVNDTQSSSATLPAALPREGLNPFFLLFSDTWLALSDCLLVVMKTTRQWTALDMFFFFPLHEGRRRSLSSFSWCLLLFMAGFGINGPKALLQLKATEQCLLTQSLWEDRRLESLGMSIEDDSNRLNRTRRKASTGTVSGCIGLCAQLGASCSGLLLAVYLQIDYAFLWPSLVMLCLLLLILLVVCRSLEISIDYLQQQRHYQQQQKKSKVE
eukprot:scaffold1884_cov343-Ochromonas_danica.AAC.50